jgi:glycosyltransferase involved in cell wall biosynthesis
MIMEGFPDDDIQIIPHGIDVDRYKNAKPIRLEGEPSLLWVGYSNWEKGMDLALESFQRLLINFPKSRLHFVGYYDSSLISSINNLGIEGKVIIHGPVPPTVLPSFYKGADIFINPSRWESFSIVNLEGMAAAKPVVTTNAGAMPEVVEHNVSGLVVRQDPESIRAAIELVCQDRELAVRLGKNALKRAMTFDWSIVALRHLELYKSIVERIL